MKLHLSLLEKLIELPSKVPVELRQILDEVGLEVKNVEDSAGQVVYTIETLANRADHRSALGVARELSARLLTGIKYPQLASSLPERKTSIPVSNTTEKCHRYALLEMQLPAELTLRNDISGALGEVDSERHAIVHILNYILLEIGQPMHAFDREKVDGEVRVALTEKEEVIEALDGKSYKVPAGAVVIRDKKNIIAVAGVIGCANSMVTKATRSILVESAMFDPVSVRKTARSMGIQTDASFVFERGADVDLVIPALKRIVFLTAGDAVHAAGLSYLEGKPTERRVVPLSLERIRAQLGLPRLSDAEVTARLKNLGFLCEPESSLSEKPEKDKKFKCVVPSWRLNDVVSEEDLIEDFARSHGLNRVKIELPPLDPELPEENEIEKLVRKFEAALHGAGFFEVITKSLYSQEEVNLIESLAPNLKGAHIGIKNALERNNSHLKLTNLISLGRLAEENHRHGVTSVKVYEVGRLFSLASDTGSKYQYERDILTLGISGRWREGEWQGAEAVAELLSHLAGVVAGVGASVEASVTISKSKDGLLHPGAQGAIKVGRTEIGKIGLMHPAMKDNLGLKNPLIYGEIDLQKLLAVSSERAFGRPSDFPSIRRDITIKLPEREFAGKVLKIISEAKPTNHFSTLIVNDFKKPDETFRRVSYRITFQSPERTLESAEVDLAMNTLLSTLKSEHQLELA